MCENIENLKNMDSLNGNDPFLPNFNEIGNDPLNQAYPEECIADYFYNSVILVTGGTGFVGKALLEKLLRSCPGIDTIYVLMRPKRGLTVDQRYKELLKNQVFDRIRARWPERLSKLYAITGDVSAPNLGVSPEQQLLLKRCHTVFHSAATVKFTEPLHAATVLNVQGTATLLKLAGDMPLLKALVHVSTAYSNAPRSYIEERVYPPPYDPECIIKCTKLLPADTVNIIAESLQGEHPNPYTLTKSLAESIVYNHTELPVCIIRPSIVTAAFQEPYPGWIDNVYGVTGIIMEISRGTYRSGYCRERYVVDLVPVDMVVNSCILAAWRQGSKKPGRCPVYNVTSGSINPLQWGHFTNLCVKWARENPTKYVMWYPNFAFTESRFINTFWEISCHFLPAFLYDLMLRAQGRKAIMMKLARRFKMAAATGEYFANHEWQFGISELTALHNEASVANDSSAFIHWPGQFDWDSYIGSYMLGIRRFILKDTTESLPEARNKLNSMMKLARRFKMAAATGEYFANHEWQFGISELTALHNEASVANDSSAFIHWPGQFDWDSYIGSYMLGIRRFILKDTTESLPEARNKLNRLYWVHRLVQVATGYYVFKFLAGRLR